MRTIRNTTLMLTLLGTTLMLGACAADPYVQHPERYNAAALAFHDSLGQTKDTDRDGALNVCRGGTAYCGISGAGAAGK